jgi:hypothetical protein
MTIKNPGWLRPALTGYPDWSLIQEKNGKKGKRDINVAEFIV